jgi:hypothetical protein
VSKPIHTVFPPDVTVEQARKRTGDAVFSLFALDLAPFRHASEDKVGDMTVDRWSQEGRDDTVIDLTTDQSTGVSFVSVISGDKAHAVDVASKLNEFLMLPKAEHFVHLALRDPGDGPALVRAAIAWNEDEHPQLRKVIEERLSDMRKDVRGAAAKAAALVTWPSLVSPLKAAELRETDPTLRRFIGIALKKCGATS